ncbi:uncharacterized protein LOC134715897 [Mytilus trossulus]|uniref:uncharacterized protein LOC134715897 n=1 Tax=Mytilus trossulus TaxID=6551 RepID=UPI003004FB70
MDELTAKLACDFSVSSDPNSTAAVHPRFSQYKSRNRIDQETRRNRILEEQKKHRFDYLSHVRNLSEGQWDNADAESVDSQESMDIQVTEENVNIRRPGKYYRNQLMYSEWLVEVPDDFMENYLTVVCPVGKRCLVIASRGKTTAYAKSGYQVAQFRSHFPGGNKSTFKDNAILDCIFNEAEGIYYILDIMCWKNHPIYDSETEFRFFWLNSKMSETSEVMTKSEGNPYRFLPLSNCPPSKEAIGAAVAGAAFEVDGLLFYHKRTHYTFGSTPLVVWLKPYMLPEILGMTVPEKLAAQKPDNYTTYAAHMEQVAIDKEKKEAEIKAKKEARQKEFKEKGEKMETTGEKGNKKKGRRNNRQHQQQNQGYNYSGYGYGNQDYYGQQDYYYDDQYGNKKEDEMELMQSEWMTALPEKFETDWFMIACPTGKRQMVMSGMGTTCSQNKMGMVMDEFRSLFPGGNPSNSRGSCILDCIYNKSENTFYIIDVMYWKDQSLQDCEADFRYFWLKQRLNDERLWLDKVSKLNEHNFVMVNDVPCTKKAIEQEMNTVTYQIDGLLFYKRSSPYINGVTSDCLWLKPHMLQDLMDEDIKIPEFQLSRRPELFKFEEHLEKVKKEKEQVKNKSKPRWAKKPKANISQLVDEISQLYIEKRGGNIPEGVVYNQPQPGQEFKLGAIGTGRGRGRGKKPIISPARFNPDQFQRPGNYVGAEDYQYDGETFAHLGGYRNPNTDLGVLDMPRGEEVAHLGAFRGYDECPDLYNYQGYDYTWGDPSGMGLGLGMDMGVGMGMGMGMQQTRKKGMGRGMLGLGVSMGTPQYNMWGYSTDNKKTRGKGRGGLLSDYKKTHK